MNTFLRITFLRYPRRTASTPPRSRLHTAGRSVADRRCPERGQHASEGRAAVDSLGDGSVGVLDPRPVFRDPRPDGGELVRTLARARTRDLLRDRSSPQPDDVVLRGSHRQGARGQPCVDALLEQSLRERAEAVADEGGFLEPFAAGEPVHTPLERFEEPARRGEGGDEGPD